MTSLTHLSRRLTASCLRNWLPIVCSAAWIGTSVAALGFLWKYENTVCSQPATPATWPEESRIPRAEGVPTLVMFAHPKCPCTRASIGELTVVMAHNDSPARARVLFYRPAGFPEEWAHTDLWRSAAAIPGVDVESDLDGAEAARFGANTSGAVVLYDAAGRLMYSGGITGERGHSGDNYGEQMLQASLAGKSSKAGARVPVLGCSIHSTLVKGMPCTK